MSLSLSLSHTHTHTYNTWKWKWSHLVAQSCLTLCNPMDYSLPGSSVHGIFQAIVLEWIAISFSRGSSQPRDRTRVSRIVQFSSVQSLSHVWFFATPWIAALQASLSMHNSRSSLRLTSIESVMPSSHLILCRPLFLLPPNPSESFPMSQLFAWGGQSTGVSALPSFLPKKSQGWSPSEWTGWISTIVDRCFTVWATREVLI